MDIQSKDKNIWLKLKNKTDTAFGREKYKHLLPQNPQAMDIMY